MEEKKEVHCHSREPNIAPPSQPVDKALAQDSAEVLTSPRIVANRRNSLKSTGPRTDRGKQFASENAIRHGLLSKDVVLRRSSGEENANEYEALLESLTRDLEPSGTLEELLVEKIAVSFWRLYRAVRGERLAFDGDFPPSRLGLVNIDLLVRYHTAIERELYRAMNHLDRLQRQRKGEHVPAPVAVEVDLQP